MGNGNRPTPEFRREAVRLSPTSGRTRLEIVEDLGIGLSTLTRWLSQERGILISMSGRGNCSGSMVETFLKTIKSEIIWPVAWQSRQQAENAVAKYIDGLYNPVRRHSSLGFQSPIAFERKAREVS